MYAAPSLMGGGKGAASLAVLALQPAPGGATTLYVPLTQLRVAYCSLHRNDVKALNHILHAWDEEQSCDAAGFVEVSHAYPGLSEGCEREEGRVLRGAFPACSGIA
jgi:hypothetical protein